MTELKINKKQIDVKRVIHYVGDKNDQQYWTVTIEFNLLDKKQWKGLKKWLNLK